MAGVVIAEPDPARDEQLGQPVGDGYPHRPPRPVPHLARPRPAAARGRGPSARARARPPAARPSRAAEPAASRARDPATAPAARRARAGAPAPRRRRGAAARRILGPGVQPAEERKEPPTRVERTTPTARDRHEHQAGRHGREQRDSWGRPCRGEPAATMGPREGTRRCPRWAYSARVGADASTAGPASLPIVTFPRNRRSSSGARAAGRGHPTTPVDPGEGAAHQPWRPPSPLPLPAAAGRGANAQGGRRAFVRRAAPAGSDGFVSAGRATRPILPHRLF